MALMSIIESWTPQMRQAMLSQPGHQLDWRIRRDFYLAVGDSLQAKRFRGWLAILSAQRVLPLVLVVTPWNPQPLQDLEAAIWFLRDPAKGNLDTITDISYHANGNDLEFDVLNETFREDVNCAAFATYKVLLEVAGWLNPFEHAPSFHRGDGIWWLGAGMIPDHQIKANDEDWSTVATVGDAAGTAAVASACSAESTTCDPGKLRTFWLWWLETAIPLASRLSEENDHLYWS